MDLQHFCEWQEKQTREQREWQKQQRDAERAFQNECRKADRAWHELQARDNQEWQERHAKQLAIANWSFQAFVVLILAVVTLVFGWLARPVHAPQLPPTPTLPSPPVIIHIDKEGNTTIDKEKPRTKPVTGSSSRLVPSLEMRHLRAASRNTLMATRIETAAPDGSRRHCPRKRFTSPIVA